MPPLCKPGQLLADVGAHVQKPLAGATRAIARSKKALQYAEHTKPTVKQRNNQNRNDRYAKYSLAAAALLPNLI